MQRFLAKNVDEIHLVHFVESAPDLPWGQKLLDTFDIDNSTRVHLVRCVMVDRYTEAESQVSVFMDQYGELTVPQHLHLLDFYEMVLASDDYSRLLWAQAIAQPHGHMVKCFSLFRGRTTFRHKLIGITDGGIYKPMLTCCSFRHALLSVDGSEKWLMLNTGR